MAKKETYLGLAISAVCLYLAFRSSNWSEILEISLRTNYWIFLLTLPLLFLHFWFRAIRWRYLMMPQGHFGLHDLFGATMIGFMANNVLPMRVGEFIRAYVFGKRVKTSVSATFATIVLERVFDGFILLLMLIAGLLFLPFHLGPDKVVIIRAVSYLAGTLYLFGIGVLVLARMKIGLLVRIVEGLLRWWPRLRESAVKAVFAFAGGLNSLGNWRLLAVILFHSVLVWGFSVAYYLANMYAFRSPDGLNLGSQVGWLGACFFLGAISMGVALPSSPGMVGTFQLASIWTLVAMGIQETTAESFAIIIHGLQYIPITLTGIIYLYVQNFTLREVRSSAQSTQAGLEETK